MLGSASTKLPENGLGIVPNARKYVQRSDMVSVEILTKIRDEREGQATCSAHRGYPAPANTGNTIVNRRCDYRLDHRVVQV